MDFKICAGFQLADSHVFQFALNTIKYANICKFVRLMFQKLSHNKVFHYFWNKKLRSYYVWGVF